MKMECQDFILLSYSVIIILKGVILATRFVFNCPVRAYIMVIFGMVVVSLLMILWWCQRAVIKNVWAKHRDNYKPERFHDHRLTHH